MKNISYKLKIYIKYMNFLHVINKTLNNYEKQYNLDPESVFQKTCTNSLNKNAGTRAIVQ